MPKQTLKTGDIVRLTRDVDRFPDFLVRKGSVGTVKTVEPGLVQVRMHATIEGCEHWDNIVDWYLDVDLEHVDVDLEKIGSAPEPKQTPIFVERWVEPSEGGWMVTFESEDLDAEDHASFEQAFESAKEWERAGHGPILVEGSEIGFELDLKTRAQQAIEEAEIDFWSTVARFYPEIDTGDFPPCDASRFLAACADAVETWIDHNSPSED